MKYCDKKNCSQLEKQKNYCLCNHYRVFLKQDFEGVVSVHNCDYHELIEANKKIKKIECGDDKLAFVMSSCTSDNYYCENKENNSYCKHYNRRIFKGDNLCSFMLEKKVNELEIEVDRLNQYKLSPFPTDLKDFLVKFVNNTNYIILGGGKYQEIIEDGYFALINFKRNVYHLSDSHDYNYPVELSVYEVFDNDDKHVETIFTRYKKGE